MGIGLISLLLLMPSDGNGERGNLDSGRIKVFANITLSIRIRSQELTANSELKSL